MNRGSVRSLLMRVGLVMVLMIANLCVATAQNGGDEKSYFSFSVENGYQITLNNPRFDAFSLSANFGYHFDENWSLHIPITSNITFYDSKTYGMQLLIGLSPEYAFAHRSSTYWSVAPKVQASCWGDWGYMLYDVGVRWHSDKSPYVGLGLQFMDSYKSQLHNSFCLYVCFGFRL